MELIRTCPNCNAEFGFSGFTSAAEICNCTTDCPECGSLLFIDSETLVHDAHKYWHSHDERWPEDGKGTGCITLNEEI